MPRKEQPKFTWGMWYSLCKLLDVPTDTDGYQILYLVEELVKSSKKNAKEK